MTIDSLVFDLETKATILRAVSHMEPEEACHLLLRLVCDIRQARPPRKARSLEFTPGPPPLPPPESSEELEEEDVEEKDDEPEPAPEEVAPPGPLAAPPSPQSRGRPNRSQTIVNVLRACGPLRRSAMKARVSEEMGEQLTLRNQNKTNSVLWNLLITRKVLEHDVDTEREDHDSLLLLPEQSSFVESESSRSTATSSSG